MKIKKTILYCATLILILSPLFVFAFELPAADPWTSGKIAGFLDALADFLIGAGIVGAIITIVYAGILYFTSGFNVDAVKNARELLKNAVIGVLLIVGFGVIINTVAAIVSGNFFIN